MAPVVPELNGTAHALPLREDLEHPLERTMV
jgi:hypothetical protein